MFRISCILFYLINIIFLKIFLNILIYVFSKRAQFSDPNSIVYFLDLKNIFKIRRTFFNPFFFVFQKISLFNMKLMNIIYVGFFKIKSYKKIIFYKNYQDFKNLDNLWWKIEFLHQTENNILILFIE